MAEFTVKIKSLATEETHIYPLDKFNQFRKLYRALEKELEQSPEQVGTTGKNYD